MTADPAAMSGEQLLAALEQAGRTPDVALIRACAERREELTPGLLAWLEAGDPDEPWPDDDPRWYRQIHAGNLLLHWRDEALLPFLERWLRTPEPMEDSPIEWFDTTLDHLGPVAVPMLARITSDGSLSWFARSLASDALKRIAIEHPEQRDTALAALRSVLSVPAPGERGQTNHAEQEDLAALLGGAAWYLAELKDEESRQVIEELFARGMIDESIAGGVEDYRKRLASDEPVDDRYRPFDMIGTYEGLIKQERQAEELKRRSAELQAERDRLAAERDRLQAELKQLRGDLPAEKATQIGREGYDGTATFVRTTLKVGRNEPCPCGSGRKYKHCHGR